MKVLVASFGVLILSLAQTPAFGATLKSWQCISPTGQYYALFKGSEGSKNLGFQVCNYTPCPTEGPIQEASLSSRSSSGIYSYSASDDRGTLKLELFYDNKNAIKSVDVLMNGYSIDSFRWCEEITSK